MVEWAEEKELATRQAEGLDPVFLNKAARKAKLKEATRRRMIT